VNGIHLLCDAIITWKLGYRLKQALRLLLQKLCLKIWRVPYFELGGNSFVLLQAMLVNSCILHKGDQGGYLSFFYANDIPIFGRVILGINCQVHDIEFGVQSLQVIHVHFFELLFIVEVGLLGEGIRFVILLGTS